VVPEVVTVSLGARSYDVFFCREIYPLFQEWICRFFPGGSVFVVSDRNVLSIYGDDIGRWLAGIPHSVHSLPPGEEHKTWETVRDIYAFLAAGDADRESLLVAFGGGVVGDLAGFAAATWLRGIPWVQVPTTLLAQVDSSVGGKTGFNLPQGKNLVGAFHQPRAVFVDSTFLRTLDRRHLRAGLAEVVKCGLAGDAALWDLLRGRAASWEAMSAEVWQEAVRRAVAWKARVVAQDEREASLRRILNFGHTVGHAFERACGYGRLLHGEAIAMGMAWELAFGRLLGVTPAELEEEACAALSAMGFALDEPGVPLTSVAAALGADKKRVASEIFLPVVTAPGRCVIKRLPLSLLRKELPDVRAAVASRAQASVTPPPEERTASRDLEDLERRVLQDPRHVPGLLALARAYLRAGRAGAALETVKAALDAAPTDADVLRLAREIEAAAAAAGYGETDHPLEGVLVLDEGTFALGPAEAAGGARGGEAGVQAVPAQEGAPAATAAPAGGSAPGEEAAPAGEAAPGEEHPASGAGAAHEEIAAAPAAEVPPEAVPGEARGAAGEPDGARPPRGGAAVPGGAAGGRAAPETAPGEAEAGGGDAGPVPVRTVTMAEVYWQQGDRETARRIVRAILAADPSNRRAAAWMDEHGETDEEMALRALLAAFAREYGHELPRSV